MDFTPEGTRIATARNRLCTSSLAALGECARTGEILEGRAIVCDASHDLTVELPGGIRGIILREEGALGIDTGETRDIAIISRVSKPVCFIPYGFRTEGSEIVPLLSRKKAQAKCQEEWISKLIPGQVIPAKVTHLEPFGCFVDIGCGISSMIPIDAISVSRISHPRDRFFVGQDIFAVVKHVDGRRVYLSHKELLGTWEENAALFSPGQTVAGIIRSIEDYGIFVELTPNLAGLAEPCAGVSKGQSASVYIKSMLPQKMKIKLLIAEAIESEAVPSSPRYFVKDKVISHWQYSPDGCQRIISTNFEKN